MKTLPPFWVVKKVLCLNDSKYKYFIDTTGHGCVDIEGYVVSFSVKKDGTVVDISIDVL